MRLVIGDLEANGYLHQATRVHCGVFIDVNTREVWKFTPDQIPEMLVFLETCDALGFHNGYGYDFPLLKKLYDWDYHGSKFDTLLMSRLQRPKRRLPANCLNKRAGPHSIEAWGYRVGRGKPEYDDWANYSAEMMHRCSEDVEIMLLVYFELRKEGGGMWQAANKLTSDIFPILQMQEDYGWLMDRGWMWRSINMLNHWMDRIDRIVIPSLPLVLVIEENKKDGEYHWVQKRFLKSGGYTKASIEWMEGVGYPTDNRILGGPFSRVSFRQVNLNSNEETKDWLLKDGWIPDKWNYKKVDGQLVKDTDGNLIKTSPKLNGDDPFIGVSSGVGRLIAKRVQCRHRRSQLEGWFKRIRPDGRMPQVISGIAATGRLTHKNIVNVPGGDSLFGKWMRKCFISKPGYVIVGTDSAGCQNRMLAARVGDAAFTKTLIEGKKSDKTSIHFVNIKAIAKAGIQVTYGQAKNLNYAFMFGAADTKLGTIIGKSQGIGTAIRQALLGVAPGFERLVDELTREWRSTAKRRSNRWGKTEYYNGYIRGLDGRPIFIESEHMILVYMLQSDEAIMMQYALLFLYGWCCDKGWVHGVDYGFVANVHDEYSAEVREDLAEEFAQLAEESIVVAGQHLGIQCPHAGEAQIGINWWQVH